MLLYRINEKDRTVSIVWSINKNELLSASEKEKVYTVLKWWNTVPTPKVKENTTKIVCRGCTIGDRKALWYSFKSSNTDFPNNTYMIFEPEPTNTHDPSPVLEDCQISHQRGHYR